MRTRSFCAPTSKVGALPKGVRAALLAYVEEAARRRSGASLYAKSHSPGLVALLAQLVGRALPTPDGASALEDAPVEDLSTTIDYVEGRRRTFAFDAHERNAKARAACIEAHGVRCAACGMSFEDTYGGLGEGFIEVHHLHPLAQAKAERKVDPTRDLVPVCSNCHRMLHRAAPPLTPEKLASRMGRRREAAG